MTSNLDTTDAGAPGRRGSCLDEGRIIAFYSGRLDENGEDVVRTHLSECARCLELARDARQFLKAMDPDAMRRAEPSAAPVSAARVSAFPWIGWAAGLLLAVGLGLSWLRSSPNADDASSPGAVSPPASPTSIQTAPTRRGDDLPIVKAPYTRATRAEPAVPDTIWRDPSATPSSAGDDAFARAMEAYEKDDFAEAERRLGRLLSREPQRADAHFYRGVCLLLLERTSDAIPSLERARSGARGRLHQEALYYLGLAYLKAGNREGALAPLGELSRGTGPRRADAERLLRQARAETKP